VWLKIVGLLLLLLGLVLLASPQIPYITREQLPHKSISVKREKMFVIPKPVAILIIAARVTVWVLAKPNAGAISGPAHYRAFFVSAQPSHANGARSLQSAAFQLRNSQ
jgi:hypothetical protein